MICEIMKRRLSIWSLPAWEWFSTVRKPRKWLQSIASSEMSTYQTALTIFKSAKGENPRNHGFSLRSTCKFVPQDREVERTKVVLQATFEYLREPTSWNSTWGDCQWIHWNLCYMRVRGRTNESYCSFKNAIDMLRVLGGKKPAFFGIVLNQMGLVCVQQNAIIEAAELFEEARSVLEQDCSPSHPDTLGVCSNLAGVYDAMGR